MMATATATVPPSLVAHPAVDWIYREMVRLASVPPPSPSSPVERRTQKAQDIKEVAAPTPAPVRPARRRRRTIEAGAPPPFALAGTCPFRALQREKKSKQASSPSSSPPEPPTRAAPAPRRRRRQSASDVPPPRLASLGRPAAPAPPAPSSPTTSSPSRGGRSPTCVSSAVSGANASHRRRPKFVAPLTPTDDEDDDFAPPVHPRARAQEAPCRKQPPPPPPRRRRATVDGVPPGSVPILPLGDPRPLRSKPQRPTEAAAATYEECRARAAAAASRRMQRRRSVDGASSAGEAAEVQLQRDAAPERRRREKSAGEVQRELCASAKSARRRSARSAAAAAGGRPVPSCCSAGEHTDVPHGGFDATVRRRRASVADLDESISSLEASLRSLSSDANEEGVCRATTTARKPVRRASVCGAGRIDAGNWERAYDVLMARREGSSTSSSTSSASSDETPLRRMMRNHGEFLAEVERRH